MWISYSKPDVIKGAKNWNQQFSELKPFTTKLERKLQVHQLRPGWFLKIPWLLWAVGKLQRKALGPTSHRSPRSFNVPWTSTRHDKTVQTVGTIGPHLQWLVVSNVAINAAKEKVSVLICSKHLYLDSYVILESSESSLGALPTTQHHLPKAVFSNRPNKNSFQVPSRIWWMINWRSSLSWVCSFQLQSKKDSFLMEAGHYVQPFSWEHLQTSANNWQCFHVFSICVLY